MNITLIEKALELNLQNQSNFPQHLKNLIPAGVVKYQVEVNQGVVHFYGSGVSEHRVL
jgi:uncharacterized protein YbcV (DUF1398 family)